eukprot:9044832-Pyramimonas_sp.AAC.1
MSLELSRIVSDRIVSDYRTHRKLHLEFARFCHTGFAYGVCGLHVFSSRDACVGEEASRH